MIGVRDGGVIEGTLVRTGTGEVPVETLKVGDLVMTTTGTLRAITWLGLRVDTVQRTEHQPIRIVAGALDQGKPDRDLVLSADAVICVAIVDEILVPVSALLNGSTVQIAPRETARFWQVELDGRDVFYANGLPVESHVGSGDALGVARRRRPFHVSGMMVDVMRARLRARAPQLGWALKQVPPFEGVHIVADGAVITPVAHGLTARFLMPPEAEDVWLVSQPYVPSQVSDSPDDRSLGLYLEHLTIDDGLSTLRVVSSRDPLLCIGFHIPDGEGSRCWTTDRARLPSALWEGCRTSFFLGVELAGPGLPRWRRVASDTGPYKGDGRHLSLVAA